MSRALVLAGGGVAGIAWELGVLRGLADVDPDLATLLLGSDVVVGTSAGSTVAAQVTSGAPLEALYVAQLAEGSTELQVDVDLEALFARFDEAASGVSDPTERLRRIGALALTADTVPEADRLAAVAARLPATAWPDRDVRIPAIDAGTGELVVFTASSGVSLLDAVAASCAVPGVWPPVTIGERRFVDGGVRSMTNADLAGHCDTVVVVTPDLGDTPERRAGLDTELGATGATTTYVVRADEASLAAFGSNPLSPATRPAAATAGRAVGAEVAAKLRAALGEG